jgi:hypothetical protein
MYSRSDKYVKCFTAKLCLFDTSSSFLSWQKRNWNTMWKHWVVESCFFPTAVQDRNQRTHYIDWSIENLVGNKWILICIKRLRITVQCKSTEVFIPVNVRVCVCVIRGHWYETEDNSYKWTSLVGSKMFPSIRLTYAQDLTILVEDIFSCEKGVNRLRTTYFHSWTHPVCRYV